MTEGEGRRAHRSEKQEQASDRINILGTGPLPSPSIRHELMIRERIDSLEADKRLLNETLEAERRKFFEKTEEIRAKMDELRSRMEDLAGENGQLRQALNGERTLSLISTLLLSIGGGIISYAAFIGNISKRVADVGAGDLRRGHHAPPLQLHSSSNQHSERILDVSEQYDLVVIGAGPGGYVAAIRGASLA